LPFEVVAGISVIPAPASPLPATVLSLLNYQGRIAGPISMARFFTVNSIKRLRQERDLRAWMLR